jgi:hypothetical protein
MLTLPYLPCLKKNRSILVHLVARLHPLALLGLQTVLAAVEKHIGVAEGDNLVVATPRMDYPYVKGKKSR